MSSIIIKILIPLLVNPFLTYFICIIDCQVSDSGVITCLTFNFRMSKIERLNDRVAKLLTQAVQEVLELVKETVSEYQQKTVRTQRENASLKRQLQELQSVISKETTGG
uniref:Uncharacterized protein n=1 Tax=Oryzias melastigma TaxID=30732 RepID=A0A3B3CS81_ORYME